MFAPKKQQIEGLKFIAKHFTLRQFSTGMRTLAHHKFMSKSKMHRRIKMFRRIKGISYEEYKRTC